MKQSVRSMTCCHGIKLGKITAIQCCQILTIHHNSNAITEQKLKSSFKYIFGKCEHFRKRLWTISHLLKKSFIKNLIFFLQ